MRFFKLLSTHIAVARSRLLELGRPLVSTNGVLFAFLIGVFVNQASTQLQDMVQRQRYLETLQYEINYNWITAKNIFDEYNRDSSIELRPLLVDDVFQAGLENGYLLTINVKSLAKILAFYRSVPEYNALITSTYQPVEQASAAWLECVNAVFSSSVQNCTTYEQKMQSAKKIYSLLSLQIWEPISGSLTELTTLFKPTEQRSQSLLLRALMGDQSLPMLK